MSDTTALSLAVQYAKHTHSSRYLGGVQTVGDGADAELNALLATITTQDARIKALTEAGRAACDLPCSAPIHWTAEYRRKNLATVLEADSV